MAVPNERQAPTPYQVLKRLNPGVQDRVAFTNLRPYRVTRYHPCPICGEQDQCLVIPEDARKLDHIWCIRGSGHPDGSQLPGWGFRKDRGGVWYFLLSQQDGQSRLTRKAYQRQPPLAPEGTIRRVLTSLAARLPLAAEHRKKLEARGYPAEDCGPGKRFAFGSLPAGEAQRYGVALALLSQGAAQNEAELLGTYGFSKDMRHGTNAPVGFLLKADGSALVEFAQNETGAVIGFQYAPDSGLPKKRLSPARLPATSGVYHVAYPEQEASREIWFTEGIHKANLTALRWGVISVACLGAGNYRALLPLPARMAPRKERPLVIALDSDQWGKPAEQALAREFTKQGYTVLLARWDAKFKGIDDALVAGERPTLEPFADGRRAPKDYQSILHTYPWQRTQETAEERERKLQEASERIAARVREHVEAENRKHLHIIASPPGTGKTVTVSKLGTEGGLDLAWIGERHDMAEGTGSLSALADYHHIRKPDATNCPYWQEHQTLARKGYNTSIFHKEHPEGPCAYILQFEEPGSTFFQVEHAPTLYPSQHQAILIDEFSPARWMPEYSIPLSQLQSAMHRYPTGSYPDQLSRALQGVLTDAAQEREAAKKEKRAAEFPQGKALFDALDKHAQGHLSNWIGALSRQEDITNHHPKAVIDQLGDVMAQVEALPEVVLPRVWQALANEAVAWSQGREWNSLLRIKPASGAGEMALCITEPRILCPNQPLPPVVLLDATADEELLHRLFGMKVLLEREDTVPPPPHMRHIAVRTGKRYDKTSLTARHGRDLARAIAECRYFLERLNPAGDKTVGLITYEGCEQQMAEALGLEYQVDTGHFWGMRGSNRLATCDILLIVGTPTPTPDEVERLARAFYRADIKPIDPTCKKQEDGTLAFADPRMQRVANAMIEAELSQCAARNRAIRTDGKIVVTFCASKEIVFLPATETVTSLPQLATSGTPRKEANRQQAEERLTRAAQRLQERGVPVNNRTLAEEIHATCKPGERGIRVEIICEWLRAHKEDICKAFPKTLINNSISKMGNNAQIHPQGVFAASPVSPDTCPLEDVTPPVVPFPPPACPAASHRLLWRWQGGTYCCPICRSSA
jgi:hypothetical protein